ncbi:extracellular solute-binding protein [Marinomonas arenicola]|uniref:ABC transporter substrate-binding protein n=1 Tax=Marinomonas TaxID=28253 RepID=UPI00105671E3|nr:extracellular solute-binding protein [Marinomonas sp. KMM3893]
MKKSTLSTLIVLSTLSSLSYASCDFKNTQEVKTISASFAAWKAVTNAMAECGHVSSTLDSEFKTKIGSALAANPSLYEVAGVANGTFVPLLNGGLIRPLDSLVKKYGQNLNPNQLIKVDGKIMAIAMMVNTQNFMYRKDIFEKLNLKVPTTWDEVLVDAEKIKKANLVEYPLGGAYESGWNLGLEFINIYLSYNANLFDGNQPSINNAAGIKTLEMMKKLSAYMDPEYLIADPTFVQKQLQHGKIAMANLWASRATAFDNKEESQVVGKVYMSATPKSIADGHPASTMWWDGITIAKNITDEQADNAFRVAMQGLNQDMVKKNMDDAIWLVKGYKPSRLSDGAIQNAINRTPSYPLNSKIGLMHSALGKDVSDYLTGQKTAEETLKEVEYNYITAAKESGLL